MKFRIHHGDKDEDSFIVEGETVEDIRKKADKEMNKHGWKLEDMWSEELEA
jgi:hypothetical protein